MSYLLHNAILALLESPGTTLAGLLRILSDEGFRGRVIAHVTDPLVRHYWEREFASFPERLLPEIVSPVQNKVGAYLTNQALRNILGQQRTAIDFSRVMNNRGIVIVNLSKGTIGEEAANLLGSLLVAKFQLAAMRRASIPEHDRQDFYLYVDEFQNFTTESFSEILAEARKYRLCLILAHQYLQQIDDRIRSAVLANAGTIVCFRIGPEDAKLLEREFAPQFSWVNLANLSPHHICYKLMSNGTVTEARVGVTMAPVKPNLKDPDTRKHELVEYSRRRYAKPRENVEKQFERFFSIRTNET